MSTRSDRSNGDSGGIRRTHNPLVAAAVGAAGGIAGAWIMVRVNHLIGPTETDEHRHETRHHASPNDTDGTFSDEPATMQAADSVSKAVSGRPLSRSGKRMGGSMVHYAFGALDGRVLWRTERTRAWSCWRVPAFHSEPRSGSSLMRWACHWQGLPAHRTEYPLARHASALGSHLAFGLTLEAVRRLLLGRSYDGALDQ